MRWFGLVYSLNNDPMVQKNHHVVSQRAIWRDGRMRIGENCHDSIIATFWMLLIGTRLFAPPLFMSHPYLSLCGRSCTLPPDQFYNLSVREWLLIQGLITPGIRWGVHGSIRLYHWLHPSPRWPPLSLLSQPTESKQGLAGQMSAEVAL